MKARWAAFTFVVGGSLGLLARSAPPVTAVATAATPSAIPAEAQGDDHEHAGRPAFDEASLVRALHVFEEGTNPDEVLDTAARLGAAGGERATRAAAGVLSRRASSAIERVRKAAAFQLLAAQESAGARGPALDILAVEKDFELRRAAVAALGASRRASPEEAKVVTAQLSRLVEKDRDPEVRRRAARALVRWRSSDAELAPLLHALEHDRDALVRGACAFALEDERVRSPEAMATLARVVADTSSERHVREMAAEALSRLGALDDATRATLERFESEPDLTAGD